MPPSAWSISGFSGQSGPPNSMGSSCSGGTEAQLTVTSGLAARGPPACSARAIRLLPVPVSPMISTWPSAWATSRMCLAQLLDRRARAHQAAHEHAAVGELAAQRAGLDGAGADLGGAAAEIGEPVGVERLLDEVEGADAHRLDRHRHVAVAGHQDDRQAGVDRLQPAEQRHAVHAGHADVADDDAVEVGAERLQRGLGGLEGERLEARELQPLRDALAHVGLVVDDRDLAICVSCWSLGGLGLARRSRGSSSSKTAPPSGALRATSRPPSSAAKPAEMARPSPRPSPGFLVV